MTQTEFWIDCEVPRDDHFGRVKLEKEVLAQMEFACQLKTEDLPMCINHKDEAVRTVVKERLMGKVTQGGPTVDIRFFPFSEQIKFWCRF